MMKKILMTSAVSLCFLLPVNAEAQDAAKWGYHGGISAKHWGSLDPAYSACDEGKAQSPININSYMQADLAPLDISYQPSSLVVENNGINLDIKYAQGSTFVVDGKSYNLLGFHFHTPSENYLDGAPFPMDAHFVHQAVDGSLAVIGVMIKVGAHNPVVEGIWQNVPAAGETRTVESVSYSAMDLLPEDKSYFRFDGSLTTPPCSEGVKWHVMQNPIEISREQLVAFQSVFPVNARPIQPLNGRVVKGN